MNCASQIVYRQLDGRGQYEGHLNEQRRQEWETYRRRKNVFLAMLRYALRGWAVFPCVSGGKEPLTKHGFKDATADPLAVRFFWPRCSKGANVAIATGPASGGLLVVDVDPRNGGDKTLADLEREHGSLACDYAVETSSGGTHLYFHLPPGVVLPCCQLGAGIDIKCEGGYVIAPPSVHPSGHVYCLNADGEVPVAPQWLIDELQSRTAQAHSSGDTTLSVDDLHVSGKTKNLIREGAPKGQRSNAVFGVLRAMVKAGHADDELESIMMNLAYGISAKPRERGSTWLRGEIKRAREKPDVDGAAQGDDPASTGRDAPGGGGGTADSSSGTSSSANSSDKGHSGAPRFKLLSADQLMQMPPPAWLLSDLIVERSLAVLYGPPGVGKTFLGLDFALSVATGSEGVAEAMNAGPVIYVAAEGLGGLNKRIAAWAKANGRKAENIYFLPEPVNLINVAETKELVSAIRLLQVPPRLIVFDTMARCSGGADENSSKDVGMLVRMVDALRRTFNCSVILIHHGTKSNAQTERGSSALRGAADTMLFLQNDGLGHLVLSCEKQKDGPPFNTQTLQLQPIDLEGGETSCVVQVVDSGPASPGSSSKYEQAILTILSQLGERTYTELMNQFMAETERSKRTFDRTLATLTKNGAIMKTANDKYVLA